MGASLTMTAYSTFAQVYDYFMKDVPYDQWTDYIVSIIRQYGVKSNLLLDLGCGTGSMTQRLAAKGFDMIGIDQSQDMLNCALDKAKQRNLDILYLNQDMRNFELYGTVGAVVSVCDSVNYIMEEKELLEVFKLVNLYLDPQGLFIFDINTEYKFKHILKQNTFANVLTDGAYIWENCYFEEQQINEYTLTMFIRELEHYKRCQEVHYQKAYSKEQMIDIIKRSGLNYVDSFDAFTFQQPTEKSERICFIARERQKEVKNG